MTRIARISLGMLLALLSSCESCGLSGEQYVDAPLERSELVALHDPPHVIVRTAGGLEPVLGSDNSSSETEHLSWAEPAAAVLSAVRGAQYISVERDGAIEYLAVHRGAAELPETALLRDGEGWRIVRRLPIGMRRDHAVVARRGDDGRLVPRSHPGADAWIEDVKEDIGEDAEAERVSQAVVALGADALPLVTWYLERERADADELVTALGALCTGDFDIAQRIVPRERDPQIARCMRLPNGSVEVCGRGAWVRVRGDDRSQSAPSAQADALRAVEAPTDAIAGALSLCGGRSREAHLRRGLDAMLAGNIEVASLLRHHEPAVLQTAVQRLDADTRPAARLLLGLERDEQEASAAMSSPALVPTLGAVECFDARLQSDGFVLYDPQRDGIGRLESMLADGPLASRVVAFDLLSQLESGPEDERTAARGSALARLYADSSAPDAEAVPRMGTLYRCSYVPRWPFTRGGASRTGSSSPELLLWQTRIGLLERIAQLPADPEIDALLATSRQEPLRWAAAYVRSGSPKTAEVQRRAQEAICRCGVRQIMELGRPGTSECGLLDSAASHHDVQIDWRALAANARTACTGRGDGR